jgi:predicted DNA-binding transcriptional regulator YafY
MSQTERIYWLDAQIRAERYPNVASLQKRFEISRRTAFLDRRYLVERLNAPLKFDRSRNGWYYSDPNWILPFLALSERETAALRRSLLAAQEYLSAGDAEPVRLLAERLGSFVPAITSGAHERVRGSIRLRVGVASELLDACQQAVERRHKMQLLYYSPERDAVTERVVRPYDLLYWRGEPHLLAYCELRQAIRQFFLGRIRQWRLLHPEAAFARDPDFDVDKYLSRGLDLRHGAELVTVRVRFSAYQARWIRERQYHPSQEMEELEGGGLVLTLRVAGLEEVRRWILGYGADAEALEPPELRAKIAREIENLAKIYRLL